MSFSLNNALRPVHEPEACCRFSRQVHSNEEEIFFNPDVNVFQFVSKEPCYSRWIPCISSRQSEAVTKRRKDSWMLLQKLVYNLLNPSIGRIAFSQTKLDTSQRINKPLTFGAYTMIKQKAIELEALQSTAYQLWRAGKFYQKYAVRRIPIQEDLTHSDQYFLERSLQDIRVFETGRYLKLSEEWLNIEEITIYVLNIFEKMNFKEFDKDNVNDIATSIHKYVTMNRKRGIAFDEFIGFIAHYAQKKQFSIQKPKYFQSLKRTIELPFARLSLGQIHRLAKAAESHFETEEIHEKKEKTSDKSLIRSRNDHMNSNKISTSSLSLNEKE